MLTYEEYLEGVNKTWKSDNHGAETLHVKMGIAADVGELIDAYKKHWCYGKELNVLNVKEELGDVMYYLTKGSDLFGYNTINTSITNIIDSSVPNYVYDSIGQFFNVKDALDCLHISATSILINDSNNFQSYDAFKKSIVAVRYIAFEIGFTLNDILEANLAKLKVRHGDKFNDAASTEEGRNREAENIAMSKK